MHDSNTPFHDTNTLREWTDHYAKQTPNTHKSLPVAPIIVFYLPLTLSAQPHIIIINSTTDILHHLLQIYHYPSSPIPTILFRIRFL